MLSERRRFVVTAKEYVVCQLEGYTQLRNDITTLEFELKDLAPFDELQTR